MGYKVVPKQPKLRAPSLLWDETGPGLYNDDEVLVEVDGIFATVSFETTWQTNTSGVHILGTARWCDKDGVTQLTALRQHIETTASVSVNPMQIEKHGMELLVKEVLLALLGQPPELMYEVENAGEIKKYPVIDHSYEVRLNSSIVHAANTVISTEKVASPLNLLS